MSRPQRVLQLVTRRQLRGAEVFAARLSEGLQRRGVEVSFCGLFPPGEPPLQPEGVPVRDLHRRSPRGIDPRLVATLRRLLDDERPDLVQANGSATLKYSVLARLFARHHPPLVYRNISVASHWLRGPLHRWWNRRLLHAVDHVVAVSRRSARDLEEHLGVAADHLTVLPRGVALPGGARPAEPRRTLCRALEMEPKGPILAHVGSFTAEKNHLGLLRVLARVHRRYPAARLVCFGDGPLRSQVEEAAREQGLAARVRFAGNRPDAADLAAGADLLVLFSFVEGMPGVVLEAGARELPVVASDAGGVSEVVADGESGLLVPVGDEAACAEAVCRLFADPDLARRLGRQLYRRVAADYDLEGLTDRYVDLYRRLSTGGPGR